MVWVERGAPSVYQIRNEDGVEGEDMIGMDPFHSTPSGLADAGNADLVLDAVPTEKGAFCRDVGAGPPSSPTLLDGVIEQGKLQCLPD